MMSDIKLIPETEFLDKHLWAIWKDKPLGHFRSLPQFDSMVGGIRPGRFVPLCGSPGSAKTTLAMQLCNDAAEQGFTCVFATMEILPEKIVAKSLASLSEGTLSISDISQEDKAPEVDELIARYRETIAPNVYFLTRPQSSIKLGAAVSKAERIAKKGVLLFVDYLQIMQTDGDSKGMDERLAIAQAAGGLRRIANEHEASVFAISSISRANYAKAKVGLDALGGSSMIEYCADSVFHLSIDGKGEERESNMGKALRPMVLSCVKNRYAQTGTIKLCLDCAHARFSERAFQEE